MFQNLLNMTKLNWLFSDDAFEQFTTLFAIRLAI